MAGFTGSCKELDPFALKGEGSSVTEMKMAENNRQLPIPAANCPRLLGVIYGALLPDGENLILGSGTVFPVRRRLLRKIDPPDGWLFWKVWPNTTKEGSVTGFILRNWVATTDTLSTGFQFHGRVLWINKSTGLVGVVVREPKDERKPIYRTIHCNSDLIRKLSPGQPYQIDLDLEGDRLEVKQTAPWPKGLKFCKPRPESIPLQGAA